MIGRMKWLIDWRWSALWLGASCAVVCQFRVNVVAADDDKEKTAALVTKLEKIVLPQVEFVKTPIGDVLDFLSLRSVELDKTTEDPNEKGVNFILLDRESIGSGGVTLNLQNATMAEVLRHVAERGGARLVIDPFAVKLERRDQGESIAPAGFGRPKEAEKIVGARLRAIIIPNVEFQDTPISDALEFLRTRSRELDDQTEDPSRKGINIVYPVWEEGEPMITLKLKNLPLSEALRYTVELAGVRMEIEGSAVVVRSGD